MMRPLVLLLCALVVTSCADPVDESVLLRLVDLVDRAQVDSPLIGLPAVASVSELGGVEVSEVWRESFKASTSRLTVGGSCSREHDEEVGWVLACRKEGRAEVELAIEPHTSYRVRARGRRVRAQGHVVTVSEGAGEELLRSFRFPDFKGRWQSSEVWLHSTPSTRWLRLTVELRHRDARLWLDDLVVEQLELTPEQELSLLKGQHQSGAAGGLGMVKRGRHMPVDEPEKIGSPRAGNYAVRDAIFAPAPTDLHFDLTLPKNARLALDYGFAEQATPGDAARVRVLVTAQGGQTRVLLDEELVLGPHGEGWYWHEWQTSLAELGGRPVRLTLETRSLEADRSAYVLWGNPEVYSPRGDAETNVVLVAVDTLRADRLSCYGGPPEATPAIDSLAEDGVLFDQAIASANWTVPSFQALFTGRSAVGLRGDLRRAPETTLAEWLQAAGYSTGAILYKAALYDTGFDRGFDTFLNAPRFAIRAEENLAKALRWLRRNRDRRFFLFLHFNDPHQPFCQPTQDVDESLHERLEEYGLELPIMVSDRNVTGVDPHYPMRVTARRPCRNCRTGDGELMAPIRELVHQLYDDNVRYVDRQIGLLLAELKELDLYDDSVVAFISDHGEALWGHAGQFAHARTNLYDELLRVPMIVKPPAGRSWAHGRVVEAQVRLVDLGPTLLELAGIESSSAVGGPLSLVPILRKTGTELHERPALSVAENQGAFSLRYEGFKYIRYFPEGLGAESGGDEELYDLVQDPGETHDIAAEQPEVLASMRRAIATLLIPAEGHLEPSERKQDTPSTTQNPVDARRLEALRALGYVEMEDGNR